MNTEELEKLNKLIEDATSLARDKGFGENEAKPKRMISLTIGEMYEAVEADRKGKRTPKVQLRSIYIEEPLPGFPVEEFPSFAPNLFSIHVKDTFEDEIADTAIRLAHICGVFKITPTERKDDLSYEWVTMEDCFSEIAYNYLLIMQGLYIRLSPAATDMEERSNYAFQSFQILFDIAEKYDFDLWKHIELKLKFNNTRIARHGKQY